LVQILISASLVVYRPDLQILERTIFSLQRAAQFVNNFYNIKFELSIIDNSCDEIIRNSLNDWLDVRKPLVTDLTLTLLISKENIGYGRGNNLVIHQAVSDYHLVINPDLFVEADFLKEALIYMEANSDIGLLSPSVFDDNGELQYLCKRNPTLFIMFLRSFSPRWLREFSQPILENFEMRDYDYNKVIVDLQYPTGCCMFFRTKFLQQIQGFDPAYFLHYEDADIGRRILKVARVVYVPSVKVTHMWARDTHRSWKMRLVTVRSGFIYWRKWGGVFKSKDTSNFQPQNLVPESKVKRVSSGKVLLTGATGFIGKSLYSELIGQGHDVCVAIRTKNYQNHKDVARVGAFDGNTDWSAALQNVHTVIHLAARVHVMQETAHDPLAEFRKVNVDCTLKLASQAAKAGVRRFIFMSSVKVNGEYTEVNKPFSEADIANPQDAYGLSKLEAEQGLLRIAQQTGMEVVIIRPPLVYGAGVKANFAKMMRLVKVRCPLPLGAIHNHRSFVCVGNLLSLIMRCIDHPRAANEVFMVSDGYDLSTTKLLRGSAAALGVNAILFPVPQKWIESCAALIGKSDVAQRLCGNLQVDISKASTLLGWTPPISVMDGLKATAAGMIDVGKTD